MILFCETILDIFSFIFFSQISKAVMASKTDLRSYFKKIDSNNEMSSSSQKAPRLFQSASIIITGEAEIQYVEQEVKKQVAKSTVKYSNVPSKIKGEIGRYALIHGTKSAIDRFSKVYTKYSLKRTTVNGWKESCKKKKNDQPIAPIQRKGRPNLVADEMLKKIKDIIVSSHLAYTAISQKMVIAIATAVIKANDPNILREFGGSLELTEGWGRIVLKSMDWVKRKGTTGKVEPCSKFLEEETFTFQLAIAKALSDHNVPMELVLNLDQTPLSSISPGKYTFDLKGSKTAGKYTFDLKGSKTVSIKGVDDKRQITATFTVTASGLFLPIQLIYSGKTKRSLPKFHFPKCFDVTFTPNHWSNYEECLRIFKKIIFPYLKSKKGRAWIPEGTVFIHCDGYF